MSRGRGPARWQRQAFWLCSRVFVGCYRLLPVFGRLRSSIAVIQREGKLLAIERSDRLGLGFPGGVTMPWESDEASLRREVREETGLEVHSASRLFQYRDDYEIPSLITVFAVSATGRARSSWEGMARWVTAEEFAAEIFPAHTRALENSRASSGHLGLE